MNPKDMCYFGLGAVISTVFFLSIVSLSGSFMNNFLNSIALKIINFIIGLVLISFGVKTAIKSS